MCLRRAGAGHGGECVDAPPVRLIPPLIIESHIMMPRGMHVLLGTLSASDYSAHPPRIAQSGS